MRMEEMIQVLETKEEIAAVLDRFSPYLISLSSGMVDKEGLAIKFSEYAQVISINENRQVIGFAGFYCNDKKNKNAYLSLIAVDPLYRNRGVGKCLLDEVVKRSKRAGMEHLILEVRRANNGAIKFYEKLGFAYMDENSNDTLFLSKDIGGFRR